MVSSKQANPPQLRTAVRVAFPLAVGGLLLLLLLSVVASPAPVRAADTPFYAADILSPNGVVDNRPNFTGTGDVFAGQLGFAVAPAGASSASVTRACNASHRARSSPCVPGASCA